MKKTITLFMSFVLVALTAQNNRLLTKEAERAYLNRVKPVEHHFDHLRNPNVTTYLSENFDSGIPTTWTVVDNSGNGPWTAVTDYNTNTLDGTPFVMTDSDAAGQGNVIDTELKSPVVDITGANLVFLSFDQYFNTYTGADVADVDVFDGTQWVNVYTTNTDVGGWGSPDHQLIDVTAYENANFQVRFHHYNADWEWYWAIDNVMLYTPDTDDLAIVDVFPGTFMNDQDFLLKTMVYNNGINVQNNFDVTFSISDATNTEVFNETVNVSGATLGSGGMYEVISTTPANLPVGTYTLTASVALSGDANNTNDSYTAPLNIVDYESTYTMDKVYSFIAVDADSSGNENNLSTFDLPSASTTDIGPLSTNDFLIAGDFIDGILVGVEYQTNNLYFIDGTGSAHKYGKIYGISDVITGIVGTTSGVYVTTATELFVITSPLLDVQPIGPMNNAGIMIGLAKDNNDNLFGIDLTDDNLYSIDKMTGNSSIVGALGVDLSYAQDIGGDPSTGNLYGTLYVGDGSGNYSSGLYSIDKTTGTVSLLGNVQADEYTICAIYGTTLSISDNVIEGLKVYPNPTNNIVLLKAEENILNVSVVNIAGQTLMSQDTNGLNTQIDLGNLPAGNYILKITTDKTVGTKQIIKK